jgi:2-polyprenyl-6-methoxyphenol hydroxylase-like FAD-dependent oxidoreductase
MSNPVTKPVVIVGGGPVGLALAGDLGWRGIECVLVEESDGAIYQPRMDGVNVRTMEFCRRWGIAEIVKACDYPQEMPQDMVYLTAFDGYELGRESFTRPSGAADDARAGVSPEVRVRCPQNLFDPILREFARSQSPVSLYYRTRFVGFEETADGMVVEVEDVATGGTRQIEAAYLVGCDGASSPVRKALGIEMRGSGTLTYTTNVIFRCPDFWELHKTRLGYRHILVGPEGTWGTCVAINGRDQWRLSIIGSGEPKKLTADEVNTAIVRALGRPFEFEVLSQVNWARRELVATTYSKGRAFLAGDSAHVMSPTGGFGMNTGIGDAVDLSWKLEAVLKGWAEPGLLASYTEERLPVAARAAREASGNLLRTLSPGKTPNLLDNTWNGALARYETGRRLSASMLREWYKLGIDLGYSYAGSSVVGPDDCDVEEDRLSVMQWLAHVRNPPASVVREWHKLKVHMSEGTEVHPDWEELHPGQVMVYRGSAAPGARAPHAWLEDGSSILDLFGRGFVLLLLDQSMKDIATELVDAAHGAGLPLTVTPRREPQVRDTYRAGLVLIRPDGHVAWRGDRRPSIGARELINRVRGRVGAPS